MAIFDALANIFQGKSPTTSLSNGDSISWNAPQDSFLSPLANAVRPASQYLSNFNQILNNSDPTQAQPLTRQQPNFLSKVADFMNAPPSAMASRQQLAELESASPSYRGAYSNMLQDYAAPDAALNTQIKQEQLRAYQDPLSNPETRLNYQLKQQQIDLERQKAQQAQQAQAAAQQRIMGSLANYGITPTGINPAGQDELNRQFSNAPLSVRNNNPLNMRPVGSSTGFQQYSSPQEGIDAAARDLTAKISGQSGAMKSRFGDNYTPNLANLITTWAPPSENDTGNYIDFVAKKTGIDPNQVLTTADIPKLLPAMAEMEGGKGALAAFGMQGQPMQQAPAQQPMAQPVAQPQEQLPSYLAELGMAAIADPSLQDNYYTELAKYEQSKQEKEIKAIEAEKKGQTAAIEGEVTLRKEFEGLPDVKQFRDVEGAYKRIQKANTENTGASDIALIFNYMKMLDPSSTVREGEFATAQQSGGVPALIRSAYNQAVDGQRLTPEQRNNFLSQATAQYQGAEELFTERVTQYKDIAQQYGYKPERVIQGARGKAEKVKTEFANEAEAEAANLPSGTIITINGRKARVD